MAQISLERWLPSVQELRQSRINLLASLRDASERNIRIEPRSVTDPTIRGWLELGPIAAAAARSPNASIADIDAWRSRYPNHPASDIVRSELLSQQYQQQQQPTIVTGGGGVGGAHIALLLPISGRNGAVAGTVRDGFMTAYYQTPEAQRTPINVYDTGETGIAENVARATQEGADIIVGPLTRDEVVAAAGIVTRRPPILSLNFLPPGQPAPVGFYQYALSPKTRRASPRAASSQTDTEMDWPSFPPATGAPAYWQHSNRSWKQTGAACLPPPRWIAR